jgi:hypothetical protein
MTAASMPTRPLERGTPGAGEAGQEAIGTGEEHGQPSPEGTALFSFLVAKARKSENAKGNDKSGERYPVCDG